MSNLDQVLDEAMNLPLEQREMLIQILQRRMIVRIQVGGLDKESKKDNLGSR